ncbi:MAG: aldo/keto reductase [Heliobacteriaceae bacterium]|nr:aldo/keto reductase [Heliobacteriaceae bacterium]MDD4587528.1 aldo/keto reductase [Heliobacteriaceae bacterium]
MITRRLGKLGWPVSVIGFGGIPVQRCDETEAIRVIQAAFRAGVNFFDSARGYTDSEKKIGAALKEYPREQFILASKSMARTAEGMLAEIAKSRADFGVATIDLYQFHNVRLPEELARILAPGGALEGAREAQKRGWVRALGITGHVTDLLEKAVVTGYFATCQFPLNVVENRAIERLLPACREQNMGTIVMKPLAGGAFGPQWAEKALRYLLAFPVSVIIPGMDSVDQVAANCRLGEEAKPLDPAEEQELLAFAQTLGQQFCRRCEYCLPCPEGINIPLIFLLDGYWSRYNLEEWAVDRYKNVAVKAEACVQCGRCEERCPYDLPIREMITRAGRHLQGPA